MYKSNTLGERARSMTLRHEAVRFLQSSILGIYEQRRIKNRADLKDKSAYQPENLLVVSPEGLHTF